MLAMCIEKKGLLNDDHQNGVESEAIVSSGGKDTPPMTEDMHEERLHVAEALGDAFGVREEIPLALDGKFEDNDLEVNSWMRSMNIARWVVSSWVSMRKSFPLHLVPDISAFKAANPDAVFEDFIRWHSPGDWENDDVDGMHTRDAVESKSPTWPPKGRLSQRMSEHGNSWRQIWNASPALPASKQRPLLILSVRGKRITSISICQNGDWFRKLYALTRFPFSKANLYLLVEYTMKQLVKVHERDVIASFFPPPTANQSWRKVLSMANAASNLETEGFTKLVWNAPATAKRT
ncbi:hypothetical protein HPP92_012024 [Vanilla planifolia]|uniref:Rab3 GTPase-activating protein catalytic subunit n=1 Tax=Vanilla planifolia TaxID=51239 RepID=A0A835V2Y9_VANPL|nr:hypothetical protein HPP92_012024 [Vanilla planifolia]